MFGIKIWRRRLGLNLGSTACNRRAVDFYFSCGLVEISIFSLKFFPLISSYLSYVPILQRVCRAFHFGASSVFIRAIS